jgi:peptide deformylase
MAKRKIITVGDETLKKKSKEVTAFDSRLHELLDDLYETMREYEGVGIAAVQVGVLKRALIIDSGDEVVEMINPLILEAAGEVIDKEGCLSFPKHKGLVKRPVSLKVKYQNRTGEAVERGFEGYTARIVCHENDHLNGIMYMDIAEEGSVHSTDKETAEEDAENAQK